MVTLYRGLSGDTAHHEVFVRIQVAPLGRDFQVNELRVSAEKENSVKGSYSYGDLSFDLLSWGLELSLEGL
jgi:hypothetical protein